MTTPVSVTLLTGRCLEFDLEIDDRVGVLMDGVAEACAVKAGQVSVLAGTTVLAVGDTALRHGKTFTAYIRTRGAGTLISGSDGTVKHWDPDSGLCIQTLDLNTEWKLRVHVTCLSADFSAMRVLVGSDDPFKLVLFDLETGQPLRTFPTCAGVLGVSADFTRMRAFSGLDDGLVVMQDLHTGKILQQMHIDRWGQFGDAAYCYCVRVHCVAADFSVERALSGATTQLLHHWDLNTGECLHKLKGHTGAVFCVAADFSTMRAISGSDDKTLMHWDIDAGTCLGRLIGHTGLVLSVALDGASMRAVSGSSDKTLKWWDLGTGQCLRTLAGHRNRVSCVAVDFEAGRVISGSWDETLKIWDLGTGDCIKTLPGHRDRVMCLAAEF